MLHFFLYFFFLARTGKIDSKDVDIFKKQVECLNFPENYHSYDGKTGQCLHLLLTACHFIKDIFGRISAYCYTLITSRLPMEDLVSYVTTRW